MVTHLPIQCPKNPHNNSQPIQDHGKATLNIVGVTPLGTKAEMVVQVITHAQAKGNLDTAMKELVQAPTKK